MLAISRGCDILKKKQLWLQMMNWEFEKAAVISAEPSPERDAELKRLEECLKDARMNSRLRMKSRHWQNWKGNALEGDEPQAPPRTPTMSFTIGSAPFARTCFLLVTRRLAKLSCASWGRKMK